MKIASLDRRVLVHSETEASERLLSSLRDEPFVVLLGEPGLGKSTALRHEAAAEGGEVFTCREAMSSAPLPAADTVYLDALDEYRTGENGKDKLLQLANTLSASKHHRWRLTCRAEDWRDAADLGAMRRATNNSSIVVARLLPLDESEAEAVLIALGSADPRAFVIEARTRGAAAFLESPLSLRLLHFVVVADGTWPRTRFELFDKAIWALVHEYDPERVTDPRPSVEAIVEAASRLCFYVLASGAKAVWRSNAMPPHSGGANEYVSTNGLNIEPAHVAASLDTALFRGEGHAFEACHRTVAEFLAARFLARIVTGTEANHSVPLRRAIALITGADRQAPSELRGLYAWFAAHLHKRGDAQGAVRLINRDAATVLAYGDAAAFDTSGRKAILLNLDRDDPYFLSSHDDTTVLGGLAGEDLAGDFASILDTDVRSHLQLTVLQALADGLPVQGIQSKLHAIVLEAGRPLWMRERASEVILRAGGDRTAIRRALISGLERQPVDAGQVALRARLLAGMPTDAIVASEIRKLLADFSALPAPSDDDEVEDRGALNALALALRRSAPADLFDVPISQGSAGGLRQKSQIRFFIDQTLVSTIERCPDVTAERLWSWINNARDYVWDMLDGAVVEVMHKWMAVDPQRRELAFFLAMSKSGDPTDGPWVVVNHYISTMRRLPSEALVEALIALARNEVKGLRRKRLFQTAAYTARGEAHWPKWREKIVAILKKEGGYAGFIKSLLSDPNAKWKKQEAQRQAQQDATTEASRKNNIAALTPKLAAIASGVASEFGALKWAADHYRNARISKKEEPLAKVTIYTNEEIAAAIAEGFVQFAIHTDIKVDAESLGRAEATNGAYPQEYVVAAGLHQALSHGRGSELAAAPLVCALVGMRQSYFGGDDGPSLAAWAVQHLGQDREQGVSQILRYWNAALDAGDNDLDGLHHFMSAEQHGFIAACLHELLNNRPNLPMPALRQALVAAASVLTAKDLARYADDALKRTDHGDEQREIWSFVALALDPTAFSAGLSNQQIRDALLRPNGDLATALFERSPQPDVLDRIRIAVLGKVHEADDDDWRRSNTVSGIVRAAIRRLSASKSPDAGEILKALSSEVHPSWKPQLAHAAAEHARMKRDDLYVALPVGDLVAALSGGAPASPADLTAVVLEEIERYRSTLRIGSETPWKRFWNTDKDGVATAPQIENEDRDRWLELMRVRFERYGIVASLPEARRGENTRADVLLLSHAGKNLPIEAKRHYNREIWTAPLSQLNGYASDAGADGYGIYLVFWFGTEFSIPARSDGREAPSSAEALEAMLLGDIPTRPKGKLEIVVLDVSRPAEMIAALARHIQKRSTKQAGAKDASAD
ncbi:hypothetical protein [Brucella anthropi]|uniref:hypothetical protein n=1 Tax=Brucella anthropi TaxID=529 RepID=UPI00124C7E37|nr:hypothetical protein [Brucella anthropi]KAB2728005.1 hypothetical protein F9K76_00680 [Brucella anthropi]KAB2745177.1 hypothetical protein F9K74_00630 [Brucella anthropi]KAB2805602.1 hypothetical protein F9K83_00630 [Brucella anthropi]